jgi:hypothetical protein
LWANYSAFAIGPEELAISAHELEVQDDVAALQKASLILHRGIKRIEVWCGSRKVGDIPAMPDNVSGRFVGDS